MNTPLGNPLHLFRAILREATYLPDNAARIFHAKHVAAAFRQHRSEAEKNDRCLSALPSKQEAYYLKRARKYLYMLQRANQGYLKNLENVLRMTYARKGKRRRKLMEDLMARDTTDVKLLPDSFKQWKPPNEFAVLLRKQNKIQDYFDRRSIKPMPKIPALTTSNKPFPKRRALKMMRKWYARHAQIIQVPLTEAEWSSIYLKATSKMDGYTKVKQGRRSLASVSVFAADDEELSLQDELEFIGSTSTQKAAPQHSVRVKKLLGNPHKLTRRFMRRTVRRSILQTSPTLITDIEAGKLAPRWDLGTKPHYQPQKATTSQSLSLFY